MLLFFIGCFQINPAAWDDWEADLPENNTAPLVTEISISSDAEGHFYNDAILTCSATVTDPDEELVLSYVWEKDEVQIGSENSIDLSEVDISPEEAISCIASVIDKHGAEANDAVTIGIENRDPVIESISLSKENPEANESIDCLVSVFDPDGDELSKSYSWEVETDSQGTDSTLQLEPSFASVEDTVSCFVLVEDGHGGSISADVSGTIANTAPIIQSVMIEPNPADTASLLTCSATTEDINQEALEASYLWTNDGTEMGTDETLQLDGTISSMGDIIECSVSVTDEHGETASASDSITLGNSLPVVDTPASISAASNFIVGAELTCSAGFFDQDDGALNSTYAWDINGTAVSTESTFSITAEQTNMGDVLGCTASAMDSQGESISSFTSVVVENTPPLITSVTISPSEVYFDSTVACLVTIEDPDESVSLVPDYTWLGTNWAGTSPIGSSNMINLASLSVSLSPNDTLNCTVDVEDSQGATAQDSVSLTIGNHAPVEPNVSISWTSTGNNPDPSEVSDLTCEGSDSIDPEGETIGYSYQWSADTGASISGASLPSADTSVGEVWSCTVTASDGMDSAQNTSSITITPRLSWDYCDASFELADGSYQLIGENGEDYAGYGLSIVGDVDGDGTSDIMVGAYKNDHEAVNAGKAYLILSSTLGSSTVINLGNANYSFTGEATGDLLGNRVASAGDVDNDGLDDILIGARANNQGGNNAGKVYLFLASSLGGSSTISASNADYVFIGEGQNNYAGDAISSAGDIDGDGLDDILIGAYLNSQVESQSGKAYVILGSSLGASSTINLSNADYSFYGVSVNEFVGGAVSSAGDVDNDGFDDILIGAHGNSSGGLQAGAVGLFLGSSFGSSVFSFSLSDADYLFIGEAALSFTRAVSSAGDVDNDGLDDILIGSYGADKAYLILGSSLGSSSMIDLSQADYAFLGEFANDFAGYSVSFAGDVDGDGLSDILVGAYGYSNFLGRSYMILGSSLGSSSSIGLSNADYIFSGDGAGDSAGFSISGGGDVNGDSLDDILISGHSNNGNGTDSGKGALFVGCE